MTGPHRDTDATHEPSPPHVDEERVAVLTADRLCTSCGYNLVGQSVVREPHYRLLIVRCPECATAASVQEYPLLGRWANRWAAVLAALWLIALFAAWPASSGLICAWSAAISEDAARPYERYLQMQHAAAVNAARQAAAASASSGAAETPAAEPGTSANTGAMATTVTVTVPPGTPAAVRQIINANAGARDFGPWWAKQDPVATLRNAGGWSANVNWVVLWLWVPAGITIFVAGWFWSLALLRLPRRAVLGWGLLIVALAGVFGTIFYVDMVGSATRWHGAAARLAISPRILVATILYSALPLALGIIFGRALTRLLIRALLPPGLRGALAYVWVADGLAPPSR